MKARKAALALATMALMADKQEAFNHSGGLGSKQKQITPDYKRKKCKSCQYMKPYSDYCDKTSNFIKPKFQACENYIKRK